MDRPSQWYRSELPTFLQLGDTAHQSWMDFGKYQLNLSHWTPKSEKSEIRVQHTISWVWGTQNTRFRPEKLVIIKKYDFTVLESYIRYSKPNFKSGQPLVS